MINGKGSTGSKGYMDKKNLIQNEEPFTTV
jgi:hypothetical protein